MEKVTVRQAYLASFNFFDWIYFNVEKSDDLGSLLGDMNPDIFKGSMSADPAIWEDWVMCVSSVSNDVKIDAVMPETLKISPDAAYESARMFLKLYDDQDLYHTKWLIEAMGIKPDMRKRWDGYLAECVKDATFRISYTGLRKQPPSISIKRTWR